jgi:sugar/nucleoside kinase (ribokinase family)
VNAIDPVGAGDSFDASFLYKYLGGADLSVCVEYGNIAGALSTTKPGGTEAFRDRDSVRQFFCGHASDTMGTAAGEAKTYQLPMYNS